LTVNMDFSSSDSALVLLGKMQRQERTGRSDWNALYRTGGYGALLENKIKTRGEIRRYLLSGVEGDLPGALLLQSDLEGLSLRSERAVSSLVPLLHKWLPEELTFEQPVLSFVPYGGVGEDTDPALLDLRYALSLDEESLGRVILEKVLILLIRRYQNLEKYYLKNFFPIRRHMGFISALWEMQTRGMALFLSGEGGEAGDFPERADALLSRAASVPRGEMESLGREFGALPGLAEGGAALYARLAEGEEGPERVRSSLIRPTAPFVLLRGEGNPLSPEADFLIDRLDELLS